MNKQFKTILKSFIVLVVFFSAVLAMAEWASPIEPPTGSNTPAPINVGNNAQAKVGGLSVGGLLSTGYGTFNLDVDIGGTIKIMGGNPGMNKVLTSDAVGLASWKTLAELGGNTTTGGTGGGSNVGSNGGWTNYVTKWVTGNTIGNSQIFDNGTNVGIGISAPTAKLQVNGQVKIMGGNPGMNKILTSDQTGLATWKTPNEIGIGGGGSGGGGGSSFSTSFNILSCSIQISSGTLNTTNGIYGFHFTVPPSMNGWKLSNFIGSACDGDGDITITPQIKKATGTLQNLSSFTVSAWNQPGEWTGGQTVNTGDRIKVGNWTHTGELSGLTISIVLKP